MTTNKFNWDETVKSFDELEKNLAENYDQVDVEGFLKNFHEGFTVENGIEKWHVLEAKKRIKKIIDILDSSKKDLQLKKIALTERKKKFTKYSKASVLKKQIDEIK